MGLSLNDMSVALLLLNDKLGLSFFKCVLLLPRIVSLGETNDRLLLLLVGLIGDLTLCVVTSPLLPLFPFVFEVNETLKICFDDLGERNDSSSRLLLVRVKSLGDMI